MTAPNRVEPPATLPDPRTIIRQTHRRIRLTAPVWSLAAALLGAAAARAAALELWSVGQPAAAALAAVSLVVLAAWLWRSRGLTMAATVRSLDARWQLRARVESAWEMATEETDIAVAQRRDLARRIAGLRPPLVAAWRAGLGMVGIAVALHGIGSLSTLREKPAPAATAHVTTAAEQAPSHADTSGGKATPAMGSNHAVANPAKPARVDLPEQSSQPQPVAGRAKIVWLEPLGEIKATQIESVPLTARVQTGPGLHHMTLEVGVNGKYRVSIPAPREVANEVFVSTETRIAFDLHIDELAVSPGTLVSYYLRAEENGMQSTVPVVSGIQFIEIKPGGAPRKGAPEMRPNPLIQLFFSVLKGQVDVLKRSFALINNTGRETGAGADTPASLAKKQQELVKQTLRLRKQIDSVRETRRNLEERRSEVQEKQAAEAEDMGAASAKELFAIQDQLSNLPYLPPSLDEHLADAPQPMQQAAAALERGDLKLGVEQQQHALSVLIRCKEDLNEIEAKFSQNEVKKERDVFQDNGGTPQPRTKDTAAGQLEALARQQGAVTEAIGKLKAEEKQGPDKLETRKSELLDVQGKLAHGIQSLGEGRGLSEDVQAEVKRAGESAMDATEQLASGNMSRALARSAEAAQQLNDAIAKQERSGRAEAQAQLESARQQLDEAFRGKSAAERNAALSRIEQQLRDGAQNQFERGSETAAAALAEVADAIKKLAGPEGGTEEGWRTTAQQAAAKQVDLGSKTDAIGRASRQLRRAREALEGTSTLPMPIEGEMAGSSGKSGSDSAPRSGATKALRDLQLANDMAQVVLGDLARGSPATEGLQREINATFRGNGELKRLVTAIEAVESLLARHAASGRREERIRKLNPDEVDPAYRAAVEAYFGKLSEEAKR